MGSLFAPPFPSSPTDEDERGRRGAGSVCIAIGEIVLLGF